MFLMENDLLNIHDDDKSTSGGPPGWFAWSAIFFIFLAIAAIGLTIFAVVSSL